MLFSVSLFGNVLGLLISAIFQSAKVIYIVIPLLVIPQIIFGGAIVRFERFNPMFTEADAVPWFGNLMASRWGFEALAVELARNNPFDDRFIALEDRLYQAGWRRDFWISELKKGSDSNHIMAELRWSADELSMWEGRRFDWEWATPDQIDWGALKGRYNRHYQDAFEARSSMRRDAGQNRDLASWKRAVHNDELWRWVLQDDRPRRAIWLDGVIVQKAGPIHRVNDRTPGFKATMYSPFKTLFGQTISTLAFNILALVVMSALLWVLLLAEPFLSLRLRRSSVVH